MSRISATTELLPGKAIYRPQEAAPKPAQPHTTPQPPATTPPEQAAKPSEQLQNMLNARQRGNNTSLKAMIADADAELARQDDMIQDVQKILILEKATKTYSDASDL
jgi:hypothetical protein